MRRPEPIAPRFWAKVQKTEGCWVWTAGVRKGRGNNGGYGVMKADRQNRGAHVVSWFLHHGEWPTLCVLHTCDNRRCVNPAHLFLGTRAENNADMATKSRAPHSEERATKLTTIAVLGIRALRQEGWKHRELAEEFGISMGHVDAILARRKWAHV